MIPRRKLQVVQDALARQAAVSVLEIPGHGVWAIDIKCGLSARRQKGFHSACDGLKPARRLAVNSGNERYRVTEQVEAIGLNDLARELAAL